MKAYYDQKPDILVPVGNGSYLYHWNIVQTQDYNPDLDFYRTLYECDEVTVWGPLTSNKITEAVISELWNNNYEQKLVNEYNAVVLGVYSEADAQHKVDAYKDFLEKRHNIKEQVDRDCLILNIEN